MTSILGNLGVSLKKEEPLSKKVSKMLEEAILRGQLAPGTRLVEENIAAELGISRVPVREAIRSLERFGFVQIEHSVGARVRELSEKDVEDIYGVRILIEGYALELCIKGNLKNSIDLLQNDIDRASRMITSREYDHFELMNSDIQFDDVLCAACGNKKVLEMWQLLRAAIKMVFAINPYYEHGVWTAPISHQAIVDALRSNNFEGAKLLLREHLEESEKSTLSAFRRLEQGKEAE
jgi:DNA-binding GntR family transcriptional regulator